MLELQHLIAESAQTILWWAVITGLVLIAEFGTRGHEYHQLSIAVVLASVTLFILLSLVEILWRVVETLVERRSRK